MSKALNYLGLARKSGGMETGEDNSASLVKAGKAKALIVASDASDGALRRAEGYVFETGTVLVRTPFTKLEISNITGKVGCSMAAITDLGIAAAFVKALNAECDGKYSEALQRLSEAQQRAEKRKAAKGSGRSSKTGNRRKSV